MSNSLSDSAGIHLRDMFCAVRHGTGGTVWISPDRGPYLKCEGETARCPLAAAEQSRAAHDWAASGVLDLEAARSSIRSIRA